MTRNTERRVEVAVPLRDKVISDKVVDIFDTMLKDNVKARVQGSDGIYRHKNLCPAMNASRCISCSTTVPTMKPNRLRSFIKSLENHYLQESVQDCKVNNR